MSTFEEDSDSYSLFTSDESSLDDSSLTSDWISDSCANDSPVTLLPYDNDDLDNLFTIKIPDKNGKFKIGSCLTRQEFSQSLLSDLEKERPEYIMSVYTTPTRDQDLLTGFTGKPTIRLVVRVISNQIYITLGSAKRVFTEPDKTWYALPLFGGKRRRLGNITGTYGASMNHGQIPGFVVYKLFTRQEIERGAQAIDTLEDYLLLPEQMHFLPFINGSDAIPIRNFTRDIVYEIINNPLPDDVWTHNMSNIKAITSQYDKLAIANHLSVVIYDISTNTSVQQNFIDLEIDLFADSDYLQLHIHENDLYVIGGYDVCILDVHNGNLMSVTQTSRNKKTLGWTFSNDFFLIATEHEIQAFETVELLYDNPRLIPSNNITAICSNDQYVYTSHSDSDDHIKVWKWDKDSLKHIKTFDIEESADTLIVVADKLYASFKRGVDILDSLTGELIEKIPANGYITKMFTVDMFVILQEIVEGKSRLSIVHEDNADLVFIRESADLYAFSDDTIFFQKGKTITWTNAYNLINETLEERFSD